MESNWQFDFWPLKVKKYPYFIACRWRATYRWKALDECYNFALDLISIGGLHAKLWALKVVGVLVVGISGLPLGSYGTKWHLGAGLVAKQDLYTIRRKVMASLQVRALVSLLSPCLPMAHSYTKVLQLHINQLVVWFVQVCVSKWSAYQSS